MQSRFLQALLQYSLVLWIAVTLNFLLPRLMPGNPLALLAGEDVGLLPAAARDAIMAKHQLDQPLWHQYLTYLGAMARGDWGYSYQQNRPIGEILAERIPWTLLLAGSGLLLSTLIGVLCGMVAAWYQGRSADVGLLSFFLVLDALPPFWVGMVLIALFAVGLGWFPTFGAYTAWKQLEGWDKLADMARHLVLPLTTLTIASVAGNFVITRYALVDILREPYIMVARAKGVAPLRLMFRHVLQNAWLPMITVFMMNLGFVLGGATVIETVFAYPGVGRLLFEAVKDRDYPLLQATFLLITVSILLTNLLSDWLCSVADPRVRYGTRR